MFVIFNQHSCHTFQNGYIGESTSSELQGSFGPLFIASFPFRKRVDIFQYLSPFIFTGCFLKSPAFLFKISANEIFLFDEVSGPCNSLSTLLAVLQDNIFSAMVVLANESGVLFHSA